VYAAEVWDPATQAFTVLAGASIPRNYHSIALLLPDARIFSGGAGLCGVGCPCASGRYTLIETLDPRSFVVFINYGKQLASLALLWRRWLSGVGCLRAHMLNLGQKP